jgi:hypothetical protein
VTALIKELLILNRAESTLALEPPTVKVARTKVQTEENQARTGTSSLSLRQEES